MRTTTMNCVPRTRSASDWGFFAARSGSEQVSLPILDALRPLHSHQAVSHHVQIGERTGDEQPIRVFRNTAIAHLGEAKDALDDADGVLDPGTHARARPIDHALTRLEVFVATPAMAIFSTVLPVFITSEALRRIGAKQVALFGALRPVTTLFFRLAGTGRNHDP